MLLTQAVEMEAAPEGARCGAADGDLPSHAAQRRSRITDEDSPDREPYRHFSGVLCLHEGYLRGSLTLSQHMP